MVAEKSELAEFVHESEGRGLLIKDVRGRV